MWGRLLRFGISGASAAAASYACFISLFALGFNYEIATVAAWVLAVLVSFALNRRFTFGVRAAGHSRDFGLFVLGALAQLAISMAGFWVTIGNWKMDPSVAYACLFPVNVGFSFAFMRMVVFRRHLREG